MKMESLYMIRENLCGELDKIARKGEQMTSNDLERTHMMTDTIKNIDKIAMLEEDGGYSQTGDWEARGMYSNRRGYSRANGGYSNGGHYMTYANDGNSYRNNSGNYNSYRRGYSRDEGMQELKGQLEEMMSDERLNPEQRDSLRRAMDAMR